jgi:hypothetical protein
MATGLPTNAAFIAAAGSSAANLHAVDLARANLPGVNSAGANSVAVVFRMAALRGRGTGVMVGATMAGDEAAITHGQVSTVAAIRAGAVAVGVARVGGITADLRGRTTAAEWDGTIAALPLPTTVRMVSDADIATAAVGQLESAVTVGATAVEATAIGATMAASHGQDIFAGTVSDTVPVLVAGTDLVTDTVLATGQGSRFIEDSADTSSRCTDSRGAGSADVDLVPRDAVFAAIDNLQCTAVRR